ncbi:hypothetical protein G7Y79_00001g003370 [Physcia stellaris]|nr:hypothetical protein G7Y79_00001g003370 [Physcia stellaris]
MFKAALKEKWQETLPNFEEKERYDFDLDFIITRVEHILGVTYPQAKKRVLNDDYIQIERNEEASFDIICEKCLIRHNVYVDIKTYLGEKAEMYGQMRTGCCGRSKVLILEVNPWINIQNFLSRESLPRTTTSQPDLPDTLRQELRTKCEARHYTFMEWHQSIVNAERSTDPQELMSIEDETRRLYNELKSSGGMSIWRIEKCLSPEIFLEAVDSPASTSSETFGIGDRIGNFAISSESSSVTDEEKGEEDETSLDRSTSDD